MISLWPLEPSPHFNHLRWLDMRYKEQKNKNWKHSNLFKLNKTMITIYTSHSMVYGIRVWCEIILDYGLCVNQNWTEEVLVVPFPLIQKPLLHLVLCMTQLQNVFSEISYCIKSSNVVSIKSFENIITESDKIYGTIPRAHSFQAKWICRILYPLCLSSTNLLDWQ